MKTQKKELKFDKNSITELNDLQVYKVIGGDHNTTTGDDPTTYVCSNCIPNPFTKITKKFEP